MLCKPGLGQGFRPARHLCACVVQEQLVRIGLSDIPCRYWIAQARQAGIRDSYLLTEIVPCRFARSGPGRPGLTSERLRFHGTQFCQFPDVIVEMKPFAGSYEFPVLNADALGHVLFQELNSTQVGGKSIPQIP